MLNSIVLWALKIAAKSWFKPVVIGLIVGLIAIVVSSIFLYVRAAERAMTMVPVLEEKLTLAKSEVKQNQQEFERCESINKYNETEAMLQRDRANLALAEIDKLRSKADTKIGDINDEAIKMRKRNLACPALDNTFRRWVRDGM